MNNKKIAIIDMKFHKKTKSFDFLKKLFEGEFEKVEYFYNDSLKKGKIEKGFLKRDFDMYIFFQIIPEMIDLLRLKNKRILLVPMYDGFIINKYYRNYLKCFHIKIICFSRALYDFFKTNGLDCIYTQYYSPPLNYKIKYKNKRVFFWYRGNISWNQVKTIIGDQKLELLTIKNIPDPKYKKLKISDKDMKKYNIKLVNEFFPTQEEGFKNVAEHNIYISPRKREGIGHTFLEAMGLGQCVIANNEATMNEYITDKKTGFLTDFKEKINLDNFEKIGKQAKITYMKKQKERLEKEKEIIKYINTIKMIQKKSKIIYLTLHIPFMIHKKIKIYIRIFKNKLL